MRLTLISLALATLFLLPEAARQFDFSLPLEGVLRIPATGLDYLGVFFHEIGHAVIAWIFGYPSLPTFDFANGGGFAYTTDRMAWLLPLIYGGLGALAIWLYRIEARAEMTVVSVIALLHASIAFNDGHQALILFMGHGTEILVGAYCLYRAILGKTQASHGVVERYLNMIFGLFTFEKNGLLFSQLATSDIARMAYEAQKGGHAMGDFSRIADICNTGLPAVSVVMLVYMLAVGTGLAYAVRYARSFEAEEDLLAKAVD